MNMDVSELTLKGGKSPPVSPKMTHMIGPLIHPSNPPNTTGFHYHRIKGHANKFMPKRSKDELVPRDGGGEWWSVDE